MGDVVLFVLLGLPMVLGEDLAALLLVSGCLLGLILLAIGVWAWTEHRGHHRMPRVVRRDSGLLTPGRRATYQSRHAAPRTRVRQEVGHG